MGPHRGLPGSRSRDRPARRQKGGAEGRPSGRGPNVAGRSVWSCPRGRREHGTSPGVRILHPGRSGDLCTHVGKLQGRTCRRPSSWQKTEAAWEVGRGSVTLHSTVCFARNADAGRRVPRLVSHPRRPNIVPTAIAVSSTRLACAFRGDVGTAHRIRTRRSV